MTDLSSYLKRAAQKTGFHRVHFEERRFPTQADNILAIPFFGDLVSTFILSSFILKSYKNNNPDKYIILCSWSGFQGLFPYVDEYWQINDESAVKTLAAEANYFYNTSNLAIEITRSLTEVVNTLTARELNGYYDKGFTKKYWDEYKEIKRFLPEIPSINKVADNIKLQLEHRQGKQVIIYPAIKMRCYNLGKPVYVQIRREFWQAVIDRLLQSGYAPVIYQNWFTYDMSPDFTSNCVYLTATSIIDVLAVFRHVGCVLDVHSGINRLAMAARCQVISITERSLFIGNEEYVLDDLLPEISKKYFFAFATQLAVGSVEDWKVNYLDGIVHLLNETKRTKLPSTNESYEVVSYEAVRERKTKRLGVHFLKTKYR